MTEDIFDVSLVIDAATMQAANETQSFNLGVPDTGVKPGRNKFGETQTWTEKLLINTSEIGIVPAGINADGDPTPKRVFIDVKFAVAPDTLDPKNVGRVVRQRYLLNPVELNTHGSKERTMSLMSIGKLNGLLRAAGFDIEPGTSTDLAEYFMANGENQSRVSGLNVYADFRNYTDKTGQKRQDIIAFDSADSAGA